MKLKSFCTKKEMVSNLKGFPHGMVENLYQPYITQGANKNIQGDQTTKLPKINDLMKKWAPELNRTFSKA
jgi:hypothetical protein